MTKEDQKNGAALEEQAEFRRTAKKLVEQKFSSPTPLWYRVIMFSLMIIGILWIMTFYISSSAFPIPGIASWNIVIGVGLMMVGLLMTTRWH